ncbi:coiled-coil domain-containing protein 12-like [Anopheles albimanus]|uniref:Cwf18 pre-mRNA splicing factor n=1 Tax=Anopheles albimanus TaxID=7167 RepID=A0A8W7K7M2_ANOAL|nr:coiled-coil domain-containing protein 12-like [Anopheles albimanus]XP_035781743.1 coiled-coil domain-containing protein 12-like [Anopheles albimanus]XP_035781744.1 coiled-coil domain-containing protein 12-like [Anopheles albimanus]
MFESGAVIGKLEEEALKRKERLQHLKRKQNTENGESPATEKNIPKPIFRNYQSGSDLEATIGEGRAGQVESQVSHQLEMMKTQIVIDEIDIANLAPRKPDWDLKRDVTKKLERLERRTQKAIAELIRDRLKSGQQQNILQAVNCASLSATESPQRAVD